MARKCLSLLKKRSGSLRSQLGGGPGVRLRNSQCLFICSSMNRINAGARVGLVQRRTTHGVSKFAHTEEQRDYALPCHLQRFRARAGYVSIDPAKRWLASRGLINVELPPERAPIAEPTNLL
jgi:hypothetical protein